MCGIDETFQRSVDGNLLKRFDGQYVGLNTYVSEYMFEATRPRAVFPEQDRDSSFSHTVFPRKEKLRVVAL